MKMDTRIFQPVEYSRENEEQFPVRTSDGMFLFGLIDAIEMLLRISLRLPLCNLRLYILDYLYNVMIVRAL